MIGGTKRNRGGALEPGGSGAGPNDLELLRRARRGDGGAFHALVDRYAQSMFALAHSLVGNAADAEDVVQEMFAGAYRGIGRFEERASVKTWLTRILVNQANRLRRDRSNKRMMSLDAPAAGAGSDAEPGDTFDAGDAATRPSTTAGVDARLDLAEMLRTLSPDHRQVIVLREMEQMSYDEIAEVLGVPIGTVESRLYRARAELRQRLKAYVE
jgi:RNA polymerase sigma-70 factor, ECF subfamily